MIMVFGYQSTGVQYPERESFVRFLKFNEFLEFVTVLTSN